MRRSISSRLITSGLMVAALIGSSVMLSGCIVLPPRGGCHARVWAPGYEGPTHVWIGGHWRYR